ncbi:uncharacterized protein METZ01_LOCUS222478, partial [marine metagenome]
ARSLRYGDVAVSIDAVEFACFLAEPGKLPFQRHMRRRAMQWMVTDQA